MEAAARKALASFVSERLAELTRLFVEACELAGEPLSEKQKRILLAAGTRLAREL